MLADRDEALGKQVASDLGDNCAFHEVDVSDLDQVEEMVEATIDQFGRLDILFNNAGIGDFGETPDIDLDTWHKVIAVDLHSVFYGCRAAIPHLRATGRGAIDTGSPRC
jgi:meso-butanediol dehydrogenase/(S,S)-butanediol dehydrogenase/diacetyl reductase